MIKSGDEKQLQSILPGSIAADKQVKTLAVAIERALQDAMDNLPNVLLLPNLNILNETMLDELAWQYHVDGYDYKMDIYTKRILLRRSLAEHHYKGTPAAVEEICSSLFSSARVQEWHEYGGEPYHFRITVTAADDIQGADDTNRLTAVINQMKNVRSWLDEIVYVRAPAGGVAIGGAVNVGKTITIREE